MGRNTKNTFEDACVFKVTFENGTSEFDAENSPGWEIAVRMLYQLISVEPIAFANFRQSPKIRKDLTISNVIELLSSLVNVPMKELCVILLIDGLQHLPHDSGSKTSMLYRGIRSVSDVLNSCPAFFIAAISATISEPFNVYLASSSQLRIRVTLPHIQISYGDAVKDLLAADMGGHGRALECLDEVLSSLDENALSFEDVVSKVVKNLKRKYEESLFSAHAPVIKACIGRFRFN
jgi:hypothetical protein